MIGADRAPQGSFPRHLLSTAALHRRRLPLDCWDSTSPLIGGRRRCRAAAAQSESSDLIFIWRGLYKQTREPNGGDMSPCTPPVYIYLWWYNSPKPSFCQTLMQTLFYPFFRQLFTMVIRFIYHVIYLKMSQRCVFYSISTTLDHHGVFHHGCSWLLMN